MKGPRFLWLFFSLISFSANSQYLYQKTEKGKSGMVDSQGQWVIQPIYDFVTQNRNGVIVAGYSDTVALISRSGESKMFPGFKKFKSLNSRFALLNVSGRWVLFDRNNKDFSEASFTRVDELGEYILVNNGHEQGLLDTNFNWMVPLGEHRVKVLNEYFLASFGSVEAKLYPRTRNLSGFKVEDAGEMISAGPHFICIKGAKTRMYSLFDKKGLRVFESKLISIRYFKDSSLIFSDRKNTYFIKNGQKTPAMVYENFVAGFRTLNLGLKDILIFDSQNVILDSDFDTVFTGAFINLQLLPDALGVIISTDSGDYCLNKDMKMLKPFPLYNLRVLSQYFYAYDSENESFLHVVKTDKEFSIPAVANLEADKYKVYVYSGRNVLIFNFDKNYGLADTVSYKNVHFLMAGSKINFQNVAAVPSVFNSASDRYFYKNFKYGLLSEKKDTLLKNVLNSVEKWNDSIDIVSVSSGTISEVSNSRFRYGLLNNRTGKFLLKPNFEFICRTDLMDTSLSLFRVGFGRGKQALVPKTDFNTLKESVCDHISPMQGGYFTLFSGVSVAFGRWNTRRRQANMYLYGDWADYYYHRSSGNWSQDSVYMKAAKINYMDMKGRLLLSDTASLRLEFSRPFKAGTAVVFNKKHEAGALRTSGDYVIKPSYIEIFRLPGNDSILLLYSKEMKKGYLDANGKELTGALYKVAGNFRDGNTLARRDSFNLILNKAGQETIMKVAFLNSKPFSEGYTALRHPKGWIFMDSSGLIRDQTLYKNVGQFVNASCVVQNRKGKWGLIDNNFNTLIEPEFEKVVAENEHYVVFSHNKDYHYYSRSGDKLGEQRLKDVELSPAGDNRFIVLKGRRRTVVDGKGEKVFKIRPGEHTWTMGDTVIVMNRNNLIAYAAGKKVISANGKFYKKKHLNKTLEVKTQKDGRAIWIKVSKAHYLLDPETFREGEYDIRLIPFKGYTLSNNHLYDCIRLNAFIYHIRDQDAKLVDSIGNVLNDEELCHISYAGNDLFRASVIDPFGREVYGLMNRYGIWVLAPSFNEIADFSDDVAVYGIYSYFTVADVDGNVLVDRELSEIRLQNDYYYLKSDDGFAWWHPQRGWLTRF